MYMLHMMQILVDTLSRGSLQDYSLRKKALMGSICLITVVESSNYVPSRAYDCLLKFQLLIIMLCLFGKMPNFFSESIKQQNDKQYERLASKL